MGKKSRLKQEKIKKQSKTAKKHPMETKIHQFLLKRDVDLNNASGLLYIVSMMANFLIFRSIKEHSDLPNIRPEEDKADEKRMEKLGQALSYECEELNIEFQEIMNELVFPMAGNTALVKPILKKIYTLLASIIPSDNFRQTTESQIENPDFWGDSLMRYEDHKKNYFETIKELFALALNVVQYSLDGMEMKEVRHIKKLEQIRETHAIDAHDFLKLRRRATEFFRIAFATYLGIEFQPLREEVDTKILQPGY
ncbi:MAG: hypothetical protein JRD93_01325 [Deltaproteobacteria bacterium]|nr:hypothetical protein [Deltaproteobacteria bacterium]MBW2660639.1 hypothetical protein [Deltaproteobacteria bacterium]